jgi:hypothetical protein
LEAVADHNLFFWHTAFGYPGTLNDINILEQSPLHKDMLDGSFHRDVDFDFEINNQQFFRLYYLADGIYPNCTRFVKTYSEPIGKKKQKFSGWQESTRKDVERAFGVLRRKFGVLRRPFEQWTIEPIRNVVYTSLILHNWMVTDRVDNGEVEDIDFYELFVPGNNPPQGPFVDRELEAMHREDANNTHMAHVVAVAGVEVPGITDQLTRWKNQFATVMTKWAHHRWCSLYDDREYTRLRNAIIEAVNDSN